MWIKMAFTLIFSLSCLSTSFSYDIRQLFEKINMEAAGFNAIGSRIAWETSIHPNNTDLVQKSANYYKNRMLWQHNACHRLTTLFDRHLLNNTQERQSYLLCRGPIFTFEEAKLASNLYEELQSTYSNAEICIPTGKNITKENLTEIEGAILDYLSRIQGSLKILKNEYVDPVLTAAKIIINVDLEKNNALCLKGENDFEKMMSFSRNEKVLRWLWLVWRETIGPPMKEPYKRLVNVQNLAARRNGYPNIGAVWRDEMEIPQLRELCQHLYDSIRPLYNLLHGVVRFYLRRYYEDLVPERGPIPAHLLGNLWSQNWERLADLMVTKNIDINENIRKLNWTVEHMVKSAEDFYQSMGLPAMIKTFWRESVFSQKNNSNVRCHGTAADMFQDGDYRLLYCSGNSLEDFYVLHHEMGHIQYFMAYSHQPGLFRQANTAFQETIGDAIMYGVLTPQHLNRLNLINDSLLYTVSDTIPLEYLEGFEDNNENLNTDAATKIDDDITNIDTASTFKIITDKLNKFDTLRHKSRNEKNLDVTETGNLKSNVQNFENKQPLVNNVIKESKLVKEKGNGINSHTDDIKLFDEELSTDIILLFKQALDKISQIPFSLLLDEYRWRYFEGSIKQEENKEFWKMALDLQGVSPPGERGEEYFDLGAKFHVPDNTPFVRYFLGSFLQHQLFESLCKAATFGRRNTTEPLPKTIAVHRCDIYGSKAAGRLLKDIMSRGHSQHWSEILEGTIGEKTISSAALLRYYRPLYIKLENFVRKHSIPIGW